MSPYSVQSLLLISMAADPRWPPSMPLCGSAVVRRTWSPVGPQEPANFLWEMGDQYCGDVQRQYGLHHLCHERSEFGERRMREGKIGAPWRHLCQSFDVRGHGVMFVDGRIKISDDGLTTKSTPSSLKIPTFDEDQRPSRLRPVNMPAQESLVPQLIRRPRIKHLDNIFAEHALQGFVYWTQDTPRKTKCGSRHKQLRNCSMDNDMYEAMYEYMLGCPACTVIQRSRLSRQPRRF